MSIWQKLKHQNLIVSLTLLTFMLLMIGQVHTPLVSGLSGPEDIYEENDSFFQAYNMTFGVYNLTLADEDWFVVYLDSGDVFQAMINYDGSLYNMDLELYNSSQNLINSSYIQNWDINETDEITQTITEAGNYYIRVFTSGTYMNETYLLDLKIVNSTPQISDDSYEENDDLNNSAYINPGVIQNLVQLDYDYYSIYLEYNDNLTINIDYDEWIENLSISVYGPSPNYNFLASGVYNSTFGGQTVEIIQPGQAGDYYLEITGSNIGTNYSLDVIVAKPQAINDDYLEENDDFETAYPIGVGSYYNLSNWDDDYYSVNLAFNDHLTVIIDYDELMGNLSLDLYNSSKVLIWSGEYDQSFGGLSLDYYGTNTSGSDIYYILVSGLNTGLNYSLNITITYPAVPESDDYMEENDNQYDASYIEIGDYYSDLLWLDDDWYVFNATFDFYCTIYIDIWLNGSLPAPGDYSLDILDEQGNTIIIFNTDNGNHAWADLTNVPPGLYYIRMELYYEGLSFKYNISTTYDQNCAPYCDTDDNYEDNDFPEQAAAIDFGEYPNLVLCDPDFYSIHVNTNDSIQIELKWSDYQVSLSMWLMSYDPVNGFFIIIPLNNDQMTVLGNYISINWTADKEQDLIIAVDFEKLAEPAQETTISEPNPIDYYLNIVLLDRADEQNPTDTSTNSNNDTTNLDNPFGNIPGYPLEIFGTISIVSMIAIIALVRKRR